MFRPGPLSYFKRLTASVVVGALAGLLLLAAPAAAAAARLSVSPSTVSSGGTVVISGRIPTHGPRSCPSGDPAILTSTATLFPPDGTGPQALRKPNGVFRVSYTVPASTPAGTYLLGVRCGGGNVGVQASLTVTG